MGSGRRRTLKDTSSSTKSKSKSYTLPSSPSHSFSSSSSSDFEFTISISPRKSSAALCPADELFYKGQLLPLHLSPRISMVRTLLLSSPSSSSSAAARDSTGSTTSTNSSSSFASDPALFPDCDSSRPSSVTDDDELKRLHNPSKEYPHSQIKKNHPNRYFSFSRFSSVFRKDTTTTATTTNNKVTETEHHHHVATSSSSVKRMSATARDVIRKYLKKVKPLYEKLSQKQQRNGEMLADGGGASVSVNGTTSSSNSRTVLSLLTAITERSKTEGGCSGKRSMKENVSGVLSHSFSGNLRYPRKRRSCVSSCPSSMRSSPSHSGVLARPGMVHFGDSSSMEELQSAIQGAITHCKNSLMQNKTVEI
ncbi:hypothetical protein PIB30_043833 [Stylosanthes scabra]|uniref:Membrane-associated kinase regulator 1 n=1 Tax=Stylosanthes scabra TaxID=79078 RepID=A0ABU6WJ43_9FABA|nr:hypothetical protein [Stylosanthes scabra]